MAFTTDTSTDIGKVRLLLHDLDVSNPVFPDDTYIQAFLDMEDSDVKCAAALGYETIAGNRVMVMQVVQLLDLKMDGRQTAQGLLDTAKRLRDSVNDDFGFDFAEMVDDSPFAYRDHMRKLLEAL